MKNKLIDVQNLWKMKAHYHGTSHQLGNKLQNIYPRPVVNQLALKMRLP